MVKPAFTAPRTEPICGLKLALHLLLRPIFLAHHVLDALSIFVTLFLQLLNTLS